MEKLRNNSYWRISKSYLHRAGQSLRRRLWEARQQNKAAPLVVDQEKSRKSDAQGYGLSVFESQSHAEAAKLWKQKAKHVEKHTQNLARIQGKWQARSAGAEAQRTLHM